MTINIKSLLHQANMQLSGLDTARLDAEILLAHSLDAARETLYAHPEREVSPLVAAAFMGLVESRRSQQPVAYLTGKKEFWSLDLVVNQHTLIPRPETELLVETALAQIPACENLRILDLGTGSGAIAVVIARERPRCEVHAADISPAALQLARLNKARYELDNLYFRHSDWLAGFAEEQFDLIVSNPPYIDSRDGALVSGETRFEPRLALDGGQQGLQAIKQIIPATRAHLRTGAYLILEHGYDQAAAVRELLAANGFARVASVRDYAGHERLTLGSRQ